MNKHSYTYDALGQLTSVSGSTEHNPYRASQPVHVSEYKQNFVFDEAGLGRMMNKTSSETTLTGTRNGDDLNYAIDYVYAKGFAHRLERAGNRFYKYDANGNVTQEEYDGLSESDSREVTVTDYGNDVYGVDSAWGYFETDNATTKVRQERHYRRTYVWDVRNRLTESHDSTNDVYYVYGEDGMRTNKYTRNAETIYFCNFWTWHKDGGSELDGGKNSKHIFLGTERLVTKVNSAKGGSYSEESGSQYFYHSDHLGSAQLVTNQDGEVYQRIEYTPYGETWIDMRTNITALYDVPYRFTAKELDKETGLYYYGARYLDPKYSRWISTDPALGEYIPAAGKANAKDMANLPGMGGIFNHTNAGLFHYAGNNPVRYIDPDGNASTIKTYNNKYSFQPDFSVWDRALYTLADVSSVNIVPFMFEYLYDIKMIEPEGEKEPSIMSYVDISLLSYSSKKPWKAIGNAASKLSLIKTLGKAYLELYERKRVATENFIDLYFSAELTSTSRENVEKIYGLALLYVEYFESAGYIEIIPGMWGNLKSEKINEEKGGDKQIEMLRNLLQLYRKKLEEEQ